MSIQRVFVTCNGMQALGKLAGQVRTLCQDLSQEVRHTICEHVLAPLIDALGSVEGGVQVVGVPKRSQVIEDTLEMTKDDHIDVRHSALRCLDAVLPSVSPAARHTAFAAIESFYQPYEMQLSTQSVVAGLMATLPQTLSPLLPNERAIILDCYRNLSARPDVAVRLACARAFPAIVLACAAPARCCAMDGPFADILLRMAGDAEVCPGIPYRSAFATGAHFHRGTTII
jgi:hypothetical protein